MPEIENCDPVTPSDPSEKAGVAAGLTRTAAGYLRGVGRNMLGDIKLRFPRRLPTKAVSRSAEDLKVVLEYRESYSEVLESSHGHSNQTASVGATTRLRRVILATPSFLRSVALTTFIFSFYEESMGHLASGHHAHALSSYRIQSSFAVGAIGGVFHGILSVGSEKMLHLTLLNSFGHTKISSSYSGSAVAHSLYFSSLFGVYEVLKRMTMRQVSLRYGVEDLTKLEGAACIMVSGAGAGFAAEVMSHYTGGLEEHGLSNIVTRLSTVKFPRISSCIPGMITSILGFLAFEYATDSLDVKEHKEAS
jgi:hypothetical protein